MASTASSLDAANALPIGHRLQEFELRGVIGAGGFGIVYRAFDHSLEREVAIKEYMPAALAGRTGKHQVSLLSQSHAETFALGLSSFVNEAKLLARFDHASLVKVHRFWEEHGTAYMVMPLYRGRTLRELRQSPSWSLDEAWIRRWLDQLLGALEVMHREAVYHRDIAPDNILVSPDVPPVLLDFGAARRVISDRSHTLTAILKPNYAPIEQYAESTGLRQGPWTDFYALGATLHFVITGKPPMAATARAVSDDQPRLAGSGQGGLSDTLLQVCDWMISLRPADRPQNASEVRAALAGRLPVPTREPVESDTSWQNTEVDAAPPVDLVDVAMPTVAVAPPRRASGFGVWAVAAAVFALVAGAIVWNLRPPASPAAPREAARAPAATVAAAAVPSNTGSIALAPVHEPAAARSTAGAAADPATLVARPGPAPPPQRRQSAATPPSPPAAVSQVPAAVTEPVAAADPAPPVAAAGAGHPRDHCSGRHLVALHRCLVRECEKPAFQDHPQCQKVRAIEERTRRTVNAS